MNASDVIRMQQAQTTLQGYGNQLRKQYGPFVPAAGGGTQFGLGDCSACSDSCVSSLFDCSGANGNFRYLNTNFPSYQFADLVYAGLTGDSVLQMGSSVAITTTAGSECGLGVKTTLMKRQSPAICPQFELTYPLT
jgi:hypothetical protein